MNTPEAPFEGRWRYFSYEEFACPHCGRNETDPTFIDRLDRVRHDCAFPFKINSGYRCPEYDAQFGGKGNHSSGVAADIAVENGKQRMLLVYYALEWNFHRLGIGRNFVHIDQRDPDEAPHHVMWTYYPKEES